MPKLTPTVLLIIDGWGIAPAGPGNAFFLANTPTLDATLKEPARANLLCSGRAVGLPTGYMGNSEVGHMNMGAGRIVYQEMTRIDLAIENKTFGNNKTLFAIFEALKKNGETLHLMGLLSDAGVHSHIHHLFALIDLALSENIPVAIHAFMDGRDTSPTSGAGFMQNLVDHIAMVNANYINKACIASITGRYYAMDRDKRWERTSLAWDSLVNGKAKIVSNPVVAMQEAYAEGETDEFIKPRLIADSTGTLHTIKNGDAVLFFNFRADRARQLTRSFYDDTFAEFDRGTGRPKLAFLATMTHYDSSMPIHCVFEPENLELPLGQIISRLGVKQLRIAETEKYAHVTYFFNCGQEEPFDGEERRMIPSPRDVATYDLKPEMSISEVAGTFVKEWETGDYTFAVCNFANTDMVGHTGIIPAGIKACEAVDAAVALVYKEIRKTGARLLITADHGNIEEMLTVDNKPQTAHTTNPVPFVILDEEFTWQIKHEGKLGDIAPTILAMWGITPPDIMTGESLILEVSLKNTEGKS